MRREWTAEEEEYLSLWYERKGIDYFAKKFNRTKYSIKRKAQSMDLNAYICQKLYLRTVAAAFNCDSRVINRWIDKFNLPYTKVIRGQSTCKLISVEKFWEWAEQHQDIIHWNKYERYSLLPEPDWIVECVKNYKPKNNRKRISDMEVLTIVNLRRKGYTFRQISDETGRTIDSVKHIWKNYIKQKEMK